MPSLSIKDLPEDLHDGLRQSARLQGKSLNSYIISVLRECVEEAVKRREMRKRWEDYRKFLSTVPRLSDSTQLIREDRDRDHR